MNKTVHKLCQGVVGVNGVGYGRVGGGGVKGRSGRIGVVGSRGWGGRVGVVQVKGWGVVG